MTHPQETGSLQVFWYRFLDRVSWALAMLEGDLAIGGVSVCLSVYHTLVLTQN